MDYLASGSILNEDLILFYYQVIFVKLNMKCRDITDSNESKVEPW